MKTTTLAYRLCSLNKSFKITHISSSTVSVYLSYTEYGQRLNIRVSDHLKDKGNNYFDLLIIMSLNQYKLYYSKADKKYKSLMISK